MSGDTTALAVVNPVEWVQLRLESIEASRFLECRYYTVCLDLAAEKHWAGWTCRECEYQEEEMK